MSCLRCALIGFPGQIARLAAYPRIFCSWHEIAEFRRLRAAGAALRGQPPKEFRLRPLEGRSVLCRPGASDPVVLWDCFYHRYHLPERSMRPVHWVVDLGANIGYTAAHFCALFPQVRVLGVEMDGGNVSLAARNLEPWKERCRLVHAAVWNRDGQVSYGGEEEWGYRVGDGVAGQGALAVPSRTLASLLDEHGIDRVDYLKVDIEGAEVQLLETINEWAGRVRALKMELHPPAETAACCRILENHGYRCRPDTRHPKAIAAVSRTGW